MTEPIMRTCRDGKQTCYVCNENIGAGWNYFQYGKKRWHVNCIADDWYCLDEFKVFCPRCEIRVTVKIKPNGPHLQASCIRCNQYIKFLNKAEKKELERIEDQQCQNE